MIYVYSGLPGSGKTLLMVEEARRMVKARRVAVFSNMVGLHFPDAVYLASLDQLATVGRGVVLLDEASVCLASRYWQQLGRSVLSAFAQSRKSGLDLLLTAQHLARVDTVVRELVNLEMRCARFGGVFMVSSCWPGKAEVFGRHVVRVPRTTYALYDTLERIGFDGGGGASSLVRDYPAPTYRDRRKRDAGAGIVDGRVFRESPCWRIGNCRGLTRRARLVAMEHARTTGEENGWHWSDLGEQLQRDRWLKCFGLKRGQVREGCTFERPWAEGWDPATVTREVLGSGGV